MKQSLNPFPDPGAGKSAFWPKMEYRSRLPGEPSLDHPGVPTGRLGHRAGLKTVGGIYAATFLRFASPPQHAARCSDPEWVRVQPVNVGLHRRHRGSGVPMDGRSSLSGRRKACSMPFALSCLSVWTVWQSAQCDAELVPGGCGGQRCRVSVTVV